MGRLSEYERWRIESNRQHDQERYKEIDALRSNPREEYLMSAYIDGRNAARGGKPRTDVASLYAHDPLAAVNWEIGYDDYNIERLDSENP